MANPRQYRRPQPGPRALPRVFLPLAFLTVAAGVAALLVYQLTVVNKPPSVLREARGLQALAPGENPYSLAVLHRRLPTYALEQVGKYIDYFQKSRRRGLEGALARSTRYLEGFRKVFRESGMPEELAYLPIIESGYVENAVSPAKAVGVWQFTEETGRRFNLHSNSWFDKRRDPIKSTRAAALYLRQLYREFGDWDLALAAYNSGAGTVRWAMRVNRKAGLPTHYWALEELPDETRNYVPAFIASVLIAKNLDAFGFNEIRFMPKLAFERIKVSPGFSLSFLAAHLDLKEQAVLELNPELIRREVPPGETYYLVRMPPGTRKRVRAMLAGVNRAPRDWVLHQVTASDTIQELASRFSAQPARILRVNRIADNSELSARKVVVIPL